MITKNSMQLKAFIKNKATDKNILKRALDRASTKRGSSQVMQNYLEIIKEIRDNSQMQNLWKKYQRNFDYAKDISFEDTCNSVKYIIDYIMINNDYARRD